MRIELRFRWMGALIRILFVVLVMTGSIVFAEQHSPSLQDFPASDRFPNLFKKMLIDVLVSEVYKDDSVRFSESPAESDAMKGTLYAMFGDLPTASSILEQACKQDSGFGYAHYTLACVYALQGKTNLATSSLRSAIELDKKYIRGAQLDSDFDAIRNSPVFVEMLKQEAKRPVDDHIDSTVSSHNYVFPLTGLQKIIKGNGNIPLRLKFSNEEIINFAEDTVEKLDHSKHVAKAGSIYSKRLKAIVAKLHLVNYGKFDCKVYIDPVLNAYSFADGSIRIHSGLMDILDDAELAAVLSHEVGHVALGHRMQQMHSSALTGQLSEILATNFTKLAIKITDKAPQVKDTIIKRDINVLVNGKLSQTHEDAADDYSVELLRCAGFAPDSVVSALQTLSVYQSQAGSSKHKHNGKAPEALHVASHQQAVNRLIRIKNKFLTEKSFLKDKSFCALYKSGKL